MSKLHELLAVDPGLKSQASKMRSDLKTTFDKKTHLFKEEIVTFVPNEEEAESREETHLVMNTTVRSELEWYATQLRKVLDVGHSIATANRQASADVMVNGTALLKDVPATEVLELEKRVAELQDLIAGVPTLDPARGYEPDPDHAKQGYRAREIIKFRTRKVPKSMITAEATEQHAAQVHVYNEDVVVGEIRVNEWSGLITPAEKAELLDRCEQLRRACKQALSRANAQEIESAKGWGATVTDFILHG